MSEPQFSIGELSRRTGLAPSALRYYEELGLIQPSGRRSGKRRYDAETVELVGMLIFLRDVGFSLTEMRTLLSRQRSAGDWRELARHKVVELDERIDQAQAARVALQHALRCKHEDLLECPNFQALLAARLAGESLTSALHG